MSNSNAGYTLIIDASKHHESSILNQETMRTFKRKVKLNRWKVVISTDCLAEAALGNYDKTKSVLLLFAANIDYSTIEVRRKLINTISHRWNSWV